MRRKFCLPLLTAGLVLGLVAPSQASISISPGSLDFGSFASTSPPKSLLYASVTISADEVNKYATGIKMLSGEKSFFASSDCIETSHTPGSAVQCNVGVRYEPGEFGTTFGVNSGVIGISFGPTEGTPVETREIAVTANVTQPTPGAGAGGTTGTSGAGSGSTGTDAPATGAHHDSKPRKCKRAKKCHKHKPQNKHKGKGRP